MTEKEKERWFTCDNEGCFYYQVDFFVRQSELDDAEGEIWCDRCESVCTPIPVPVWAQP